MQCDPPGRSPAPLVVYEECVYVWPCRHQRKQVAVSQVYGPGEIDVHVAEVDKCHAWANVVQGKSMRGFSVEDSGRLHATDLEAGERMG
jgi:hypothetical protein